MKTRVVHCKNASYDVYIGRPSKWGNPYRLKKGEPRENCLARYRKWLLSRPDLLAAIGELKGKVLGCWCKPLACHGDILAELAEGTEVKAKRTRSKLPIRQLSR
jgi:hypothetical protein